METVDVLLEGPCKRTASVHMITLLQERNTAVLTLQIEEGQQPPTFC